MPVKRTTFVIDTDRTVLASSPARSAWTLTPTPRCRCCGNGWSGPADGRSSLALLRRQQHVGVEAAVITGVAGAAHLIDLEQHRVAVAVQPHRVHVLGVPGRLAPLTHCSPRDREKYVASRVASVRASASSSIQATISTSPVPRSCATAVNRPSALRLSRATAIGPHPCSTRHHDPLCRPSPP